MAYLVTGGTGLIGSRVVRDLAQEGRQVIVYDMFPGTGVFEQLLTDEEKTRVKIIQGEARQRADMLHTQIFFIRKPGEGWLLITVSQSWSRTIAIPSNPRSTLAQNPIPNKTPSMIQERELDGSVLLN